MARYKMQEMPDLGKNGKRKLYPKLEIDGQTSFEQLLELVSEATTFSTGDVKGVVESLAKSIASEMRLGHSVKIDGLGTFSISLGLKKNAKEEEPDGETRRNAQSIRVKGVNFRADKTFVAEAGRNILLERSPNKSARSSDRYTFEERLVLAQKFLDENPFMKVDDYCRLTGLLKTAARMELRQLAADPASGIGIAGSGPHRVYVRKK